MKRISALILALALLFSAFTLTLTSCKENTQDSKKNTQKNNESGTDEHENGDIFAERAAVKDGLGDGWDFGGRTLRVVCHNDGAEMFPPAESLNKGNLISDAKANRNIAVEDRLNINIELVYKAGITELNSTVSKTILSGSDEYDLIVSHVLTTGEMAAKNIFLNWYDIPHVDFTKPWWAASNSTELTYDGKNIVALSDLNATTVLLASVLVFNKNLAAAYDMGNLYDLVLAGNWTFDKLYELTKDIYTDSDGSGTESEGDFYGCVFNTASAAVNAWLWAFDNPTTKKDENGVPVIAIKTDKINNIISKLYDFYFNSNGTHAIKKSDSIDAFNMFLNKQAVFSEIYLSWVTGDKLRNFEDDYGILPYPKWDEYQKDYHSHVYGEHTALAVPKTVRDVEFVGVCTEALSYESWKTLTPTIYEIALKTRYLRDSESKQVLDIIIDNRYFDFGFIYTPYSGFGYTLYYMFNNDKQNFESYFSTNNSRARGALKKILRAYDKLD